MLKKVFYTVNYLAIMASLVFYSLLIRVVLNYGCKYASLFTDPKNMPFNLHYTLAMPYALVFNLFILLPLSFILLVIIF